MDIDKSKENIQPLRGGRNVMQLNTALQAQSDGDAQKQLNLQKAEYEANIRNYVGPDPLDVWFTYIQWLEQSFPKHGHEGSIDKALKTCLTEFENDLRYIQDKRFVRLWIKYIDYQNNPLEFYQLLYNKGVGTSCSELYRAWACYCEEANDYTKADQVYNLGLQAHAQPMDELVQAHKNFQLWFAERYFHDDSPTKRKAASALAETRLALTSLRTIKRRNIAVVPSQRTGENVKSLNPGVVRNHQPGTSSAIPHNNIMVEICQDNPGPSGVAIVPPSQHLEAAAVPQSILQSCGQEENQKEVGMWTNPLSKSGKLGTSSRPIVTPVKFEIFQEDGIKLSSNHVPYCVEDFSDFKVPLCVPDPADPTKIRKYNKKEVYRDGEDGSIEFSLEEIKARKYLAAYKKSRPNINHNVGNHLDNNYNLNIHNSNHNNTSALQTLANCAVPDENLENNRYATNAQFLQTQEEKKDLDPNNDIPVSSEFNLENIIAQSNLILNAEDPHQSVVLEQNEGYTVEYIDMCKEQYDGVEKNANIQNNGVPSSFNSEQNDVQYAPKKSVYADFNRSLMADVHDDSMTVHTREANREVNNAFARPGLADESVAPLVVPTVTPFQFNICEDRTVTLPSQKPVSNHVVEDPAKTRDMNVENQYGNYQQRAALQPQQQPPKINFDETCSTQMFNFNIHRSSTPIANNQFKKPYTVDTTKTMSVKKFNISEAENAPTHSMGEMNGPYGKVKENHQTESQYPENNGLSTIMETTEQRSSGSSSSGSYQTMRNTMFGNTARESHGQSLAVINEKSSHMEGHTNHQQHQVDHNNVYNRRTQHSKSQSGHNITSNYNMSVENKSHSAQPYHTLDHQYHKIPTTNYNGYIAQRGAQSYQQMQHSMHQQQQTANAYQQQSNTSYQQQAASSAYQQQSSGAYPQQTAASYPQQATPAPYHQQTNNAYQQQANVSYQQQNYQSPHMNYQTPQYNQHQQQASYHSTGYHQQQPQPMQSPQAAGFQSPSHVVTPGFQSPQQAMASPQQGFTSPQQGFASPQQGFTSPQQGFTSPQHGYASPQQPYTGYHTPHTPQQHVYAARPQHHQGYASPHVNQGGFQSPPHVMQGYSSPHQGFQSPPQQPYHHNAQMMHNSYHQPVGNHNASMADRSQYQAKQHQTSYHNQSPNYGANQSYQTQNNYQSQTKPQQNTSAYSNSFQNNQMQSQPYPSNNYKYQQHQQQRVNNVSANMSHSHYPSSNQSQQDYTNTTTPLSQTQYQTPTSVSNTPQSTPDAALTNQSYNNANQQKTPYATPQAISNNKLGPKPPYQSPTSKLRSVRHEVPHATPKAPVPNTSPAANPGFSNQFLNFISARNEPKDNANTPKFSNSPNISQKMHKNLYVSSPEQGQVPPSTDLNASEISKQNSVQTSASSQNNNTSQSILDKQKDQSKRQLDFENRTEIQNEDSRDSVSKSSRKSTMNSRQSAQSTGTDNYQMDVDSESSMDCHTMTFKSNTSNTQLSTQDIQLPATIDFPKIIDPFNRELNDSLLQYVKFPNKNHYEGYYYIRNIPKFGLNTLITLGESSYSIEKRLGKGTFGLVYRALDCTSKKSVAIKYQRPDNPWEYYICKEIKARVKDPYMLCGYMDIKTAFFSEHTSVFVSELSKYGSLLDVANKVKVATAKCINEYIVMLLASEMLAIVHHLHKAQIIHADIKPDNFLLMEIPQMDSRHPSLKLIDYGCAIDMSLYPKGTTFKKVIMTESFTCNEMREGKRWTYQTDMYCLAGSIFLILMGKYMQTVDCAGRWNAEKKWPRYMKAAIWDKVFLTLLNIKDCDTIPDLMELKDMLDDHLRTEGGNSVISNQLNTLANVLNSR